MAKRNIVENAAEKGLQPGYALPKNQESITDKIETGPTDSIDTNTDISTAVDTTKKKTPSINTESPAYKELVSKGYSDQDIMDAYNKISSEKPKEDVKKPEEPIDKGVPFSAINQETGKVEGVELKATEAEKQLGVPDYMDESTERLSELKSNVEQYDKLAPQYFSDYETFKEKFDYDQRVQKQKDVLDAFWKQKQTPVVEDFWASKSDEDIANLYMNGGLTDKDMTDLFNKYPDRYTLIREYIDKLSSYDDANDTLSGTKKETITEIYSVGYPDTPDLMEEYNRLVGTDEISNLGLDINNKQAEIKELNEQLFNMEDSVRSQYEGTGINEDVLSAVIADRQDALNKRKRTLSLELDNLTNNYNTLYQSATDKFNIFKDQYDLDRQSFLDKLSIYQQMTETQKPYTVTSPLGGIYEKQADGTWVDITGISGVYGGVSDGTATGIQSYTTTVPSQTGDLTGYASQYPNEASFKNNNPTGIKISASDTLKQLWTDAGINYSTGTAALDGGNFVKFDTIADGLKAYDIAMTERWGRATVSYYLNEWGTGTSGINLPEEIMNKKINELTDEEKSMVQSAQIKKESPGLWSVVYGDSLQNTQSSDQKIMVNGVSKTSDQLKDMFTLNPLSVFSADQLTRFDKYATSGNIKDLGVSAGQISNNLVGYQVWKEAKTSGPQELANIYIALSALPTQVKNSEVELEMATTMVKQSLARGLSPYDAADIFRGFNIESLSDYDRKLGMALRYISFQLPDEQQPDLSMLTRALQSGNRTQAIKSVENQIIKGSSGLEGLDLEKDFIALNNTLKDTADLGPGRWLIGGLIRQWGGTSEDRATVVDKLNQFANKMDTGLEELGSFSSTSEIQARANSLSNTALELINAQRFSLGLPVFTNIEQIINYDKRADLYERMLSGGSDTSVSYLDMANNINNQTNNQ